MTVATLSRRLAPLALLAFDACQPPVPQADPAEARRQAAAVVQNYQSATNAEDPARLALLYADDALLLPPDGGVVMGREEIASFWQDGLERGLSMDTLRIVTGGELAYVVGQYYLAGTESAPPDSGKFVLALSRVEGGWRVAADIWNATPSEGEEDEGDPRTRILTAVPARFVPGRAAGALLTSSLPSPRAPGRGRGSRSSR